MVGAGIRVVAVVMMSRGNMMTRHGGCEALGVSKADFGVRRPTSALPDRLAEAGPVDGAEGGELRDQLVDAHRVGKVLHKELVRRSAVAPTDADLGGCHDLRLMHRGLEERLHLHGRLESSAVRGHTAWVMAVAVAVAVRMIGGHE